MITNQQLISSFWRNLHLRSDDWKSQRVLGPDDLECSLECAYQSDKDPTLGCAIGQGLIDLGLMTPQIASFLGDVKMLCDTFPFLKFEKVEFAESLQDIHDSGDYAEIENAIERVVHLASQYNLTLEDYSDQSDL